MSCFRRPRWHLTTAQKLDRIYDALSELRIEQMALFDDLTAKVTALEEVDDAVLVLLADIKTKLDAAIANAGSLSDADKAQLQALSDSLASEKDKVAAAIVANTPSA